MGLNCTQDQTPNPIGPVSTLITNAMDRSSWISLERKYKQANRTFISAIILTILMYIKEALYYSNYERRLELLANGWTLHRLFRTECIYRKNYNLNSWLVVGWNRLIEKVQFVRTIWLVLYCKSVFDDFDIFIQKNTINCHKLSNFAILCDKH